MRYFKIITLIIIISILFSGCTNNVKSVEEYQFEAYKNMIQHTINTMRDSYNERITEAENNGNEWSASYLRHELAKFIEEQQEKIRNKRLELGL